MEEILNQILSEIKDTKTDIKDMKTEIKDIKIDIKDMKTDIETLNKKVDRLEAGQQVHTKMLNEVWKDIQKLENRIEVLEKV